MKNEVQVIVLKYDAPLGQVLSGLLEAQCLGGLDTNIS